MLFRSFWDPLYDSFDVDLVVKVLSHTAFSEFSSQSYDHHCNELFKAHSLPSSSHFSTTSAALAGPSLSLFSIRSITWQSRHSVSTRAHCVTATTNLFASSGFFKWYSRLYRNQGSLLFGPPRLDWSDQLVVVTGGMFHRFQVFDRRLM